MSDCCNQGVGSISAGETQKCIIQNYYETYPGYKGEEKIQKEKLKNWLGYISVGEER